MKIEMKEICKSFGANEVLQSVNFTINTGEISALLGENGAGKSTLMNILGGVLQPDRGEIIIDGRTVSFAAPIDSLHSGIGFIHQELNLINDLTVYENLFITDLLRKGVFLDYKQIVEICKALMQQASIIIMDEPTTSLTVPEIERVFKMMRVLRNKNVGIVFISHKLEEVLEICDSYVVLRDGKVAAKGNVKETSIPELTSFMVGHEVKQDKAGGSCHTTGDAPALEISNLSDGMHFHDISLKVESGKITALVGLSGAGKSTIVNLLDKFYEPDCGTITLDGVDLRDWDTRFLRENIGLVLQKNHIFDGSIEENIRYGKPDATFEEVEEAAKKASVYDQVVALPKGFETAANHLSGGQQQRIALARMFLKNPPIIFLDEPTASLDAIATEQIKSAIDAIKKDRTVIIISHSISQIIDSEMVYALKEGHLEQSGNPDELYRKGGVYKDIVDASARSLNIEKLAQTIASQS